MLTMNVQGGGSNSEDDVNSDEEKKIAVCKHLHMDIVTATEVMDTVEMCSLSVIPSEPQICQAISMLCREQEINPNKFIYIKFPFGMMSYGGLKNNTSIP